ncbi:MAG TPA: PEP-utilizing enzyme [Candidatus Norongarragalinales archaeon]|nr:PEP-utilizing enzyme [Candidatus Norongarragalinales archaeon]
MGWILVQEREEGFPLHMLYTPVATYSGRVEDAIGTNLGNAAIIFGKNGKFEAFFKGENVKVAEKYAYSSVLGNPDLPRKLARIFSSKIRKLLKKAGRLGSADFSKLSNSELAGRITEFWRDYGDSYIYSEPLAWILKDILGQHAERDVKNALSKRGRGKEFGRIFGLLIAPAEKPFATREEESLLRIVSKIKQSGSARAFAGNGSLPAAIGKMFRRHEREYFWVPFDYAGVIWDEDQYKEAARQLITQGFDSAKRLAEMDSYYKGIVGRQRQLERFLKLNDKTRIALDAIRVTGFMMDYKKECFTKAHYAYRSLLLAAAGRLGWSMGQAYSVTPGELTGALNGNPIKPDSDATRVLYMWGHNARVLDGTRGKAFLRKEGLAAKLQGEATELKGTCACAGTVKGPAKIILTAKDLHRLKQGDVLVTIMTTPDFVRGMKRAGAIVTNDGGITCHAAIVSREFNIPCVVGTRVATKVFRDGDILEVKAAHGVVRKVK